ncbi:MAG: MBL fold metallo-hydrolase [Candidatus Marinimicrobia bacterium]|nr:MBL fold metallo-hydrolase [Candidatus Neomarinimicrobiota bacterium]
MKIKHYLYNAFIIEGAGYKLAIDAGRNLWWTKLNSLIPKAEWEGVTHVFSTHGDPDHFDYAVEMAEQSQATVICHEELVDRFKSDQISAVHALGVSERLELGPVQVQGLMAEHGPLALRLGGGLFYMNNEVLQKGHGGQEVYLAGLRVQKIDETLNVYNHGTVKLLWGLIRLEKDNVEAFARGVIGYKIEVENKSIVNLGDTLFQEGWEELNPDILMIPIGGSAGNTMDVKAALEAVRLMRPKLVIPCHYNGDFFWRRNVNPTNDQVFKTEVEKMDIDCRIMKYGDEIVLS